MGRGPAPRARPRTSEPGAPTAGAGWSDASLMRGQGSGDGPMAASQGSVLHQQALTVSGLFTGLTLTALVLILNSPRPFHTAIGPVSGPEYFEVIVTYVALLGAMSSMAMLSFLEIGGGMVAKFTPLDTMGTAFFLASVFGFMGVLPLLLVPFTQTGAVIVLAAELVLIGTYFSIRRLPSRRPPP